jgi:glutathione S-transferase
MYAHMLRHPSLMLEYNNQGVPGWEAALLRLTFPLAGVFVRRRLAMSSEPSPEDEALCLSVFDSVASRLSDGRPFLCGSSFSAADLTFACLAAPLVVPWRYGVRLPQLDVIPPGPRSVLQRFRAHPAGEFALRLTETERASSG